MKKIILSVVAALAASAAPAFAADMPVKAAPAPVVAPSPFDIAFGGAIMTDYMWRGITQSAHKPSVAAYFEPRYNINPNLQLYAGLSGESIKFPNDAAAEIDFYGGVRPTFGPVALDVGVWYYYYPGGESRYTEWWTGAPAVTAAIADASFYEIYGKGTWTVNDIIAVGGNFYYTPSYLATGAEGTYASATLKLTAPASMLPAGIGAYVSGEFGRQWLGTTDRIPGVFVPAVDLPDYNTWNVGIGFTWKAFTLDLRYSDTDLSKTECFTITGDPHAGPPAALGSNWCGSTFFAKLSVDTSVAGLK
ncbi:MAG TPA: TorF family putative porin [Pseudolabrys sp.]|nr:TorF family putative porin [Pseudolabrys sp.]